MRNSNGGICYNDIMNMCMSDVLIYQMEVSAAIKRENDEIKKVNK
jgi:hypothetical protein